MNTTRVNVVNILLMGVSALLAWDYPFALFLFAYGVLGPLHYLTEISWLHDRSWFTTSKRDWIAPVVAAVVINGLYALTLDGKGLKPFVFDLWGATRTVRPGAVLTAIVAALAFGAVFASSWRRRWVFVIPMASVLLAALLTHSGSVIIGTFLATLIHVFVFTSCFILYGALKSKNEWGYVSFLVHIALPALMLWRGWTAAPTITVDPEDFNATRPFQPFVLQFGYLFGRDRTFEAGVTSMRFAAYAYTYHYLNWFSKTGIIRWHDMPRKRLGIIIGVWIVCAIFYFAAPVPMFTWVLGLSIAHVFLEFPLNWKTFAGIAQEIRGRVATRGA